MPIPLADPRLTDDHSRYGPANDSNPSHGIETPASGMLAGNDHEVGRTFIFDMRDRCSPKVVTTLTDMDGYMHPHSYLRLANGLMLATLQHRHDSMDQGVLGASGGLVEIVSRKPVRRDHCRQALADSKCSGYQQSDRARHG